MSAVCVHASRAIGPHFERCLLCCSWRQHLYGEPVDIGIARRWWPAEVPMPSAAPGDEYVEFATWLAA